MQKVTCFSQVQFVGSDTCPRDEAFLKKMTAAAVKATQASKGTNDYGVSWYCWKQDLIAPNTACHAALVGLSKDSQFLVDAVMWRGSNPRVDTWQGNADSSVIAQKAKSFGNQFLQWAHSEDSIWAACLDRCAVLVDDDGVVLARLFLDPTNTPLTTMNHFLITSGRFITEWPLMATAAAKYYELHPDFRAALWYAHNGNIDGTKIAPTGTGHKGFQGDLSGVPGVFFGNTKGISKSTLAKGSPSTIYVNREFRDNVVPWKKQPTNRAEFIEQWKLLSPVTVEAPAKVPAKKKIAGKRVVKKRKEV